MLSDSSRIYVVSGLPRSGTSMMMQLLKESGYPILMDGIRVNDIDNPNGYYEYEKIKKLADSNDWLHFALGKVVKIVSQWLNYLPTNYHYKIIFMERDLDEIVLSQEKMLKHRGHSQLSGQTNKDEIKYLLKKHLDKVRAFCEASFHIDIVYSHYNYFFTNFEHEIDKLSVFLNNNLNSNHLKKVIQTDLYRNRQQSKDKNIK